MHTLSIIKKNISGTYIGVNYKYFSDISLSVEGVRTTRALYDWFNTGEYDFDIPITKQIYQVLFNNKNPLKAVDDLMLRGPKHEIEEVVNDINW